MLKPEIAKPVSTLQLLRKARKASARKACGTERLEAKLLWKYAIGARQAKAVQKDSKQSARVVSRWEVFKRNVYLTLGLAVVFMLRIVRCIFGR